jgi:flagellar biogenesis protein FliO
MANGQSGINSSQMQIFFAFIGVLTCLLGSLWLLTKLTLQRKASKTGLRIVIATPLGYQKQVVIIEIGNHATQKKEHPI